MQADEKMRAFRQRFINRIGSSIMLGIHPSPPSPFTRKLFLWNCQNQLNQLNFKGLNNKNYSEATIAAIADYAYKIFFEGFLEKFQVYSIPNNSEAFKDLHSIVCWSETCYSFKTHRVLGQGTNKKVYEAIKIDIKNEERFTYLKLFRAALAIIPDITPGYTIKKALAENKLASRLNSKYIIKACHYNLVDYSMTPRSLLFLEDQLSHDFEKAIIKKILPPDDITIRALADAALGLSLMHEKEILHKDIKPANILLKLNKKRAKLIDLGFARAVKCSPKLALSPIYAAPELAAPLDGPECHPNISFENKQSYQTDLWAFGLTIYRIFSPLKRISFRRLFLNGEVPVTSQELYRSTLPETLSLACNHSDLQQALVKIGKDENTFHASLFVRRKAKNTIEQDIQNLIRKLLSVDPKKRGTAKELSDELVRIYKALPLGYGIRRALPALLLADKITPPVKRRPERSISL